MPRTQCGEMVAFDDGGFPRKLNSDDGNHTSLDGFKQDAFPWSTTITTSGALAAE
jgi:hypothetical protein